MNACTSNSYRKFGGPTGATGTPGHERLSHPESGASGGPVAKNRDSETGTRGHGPIAALFVATTLASWSSDQPHRFARDVQIDDTAYRQLDAEYYAWLRSRMNLARMAAKASKIAQDAYDALRSRFNAIHEWAMERFGERALSAAVLSLDARIYRAPLAETDPPVGNCDASSGVNPAIAAVDAIADEALALGWSRERLYATGNGPFDPRRGLICHLKPGDRIGEVTAQSIEVILSAPPEVRHRFYNPDVEQPWIVRVAEQKK